MFRVGFREMLFHDANDVLIRRADPAPQLLGSSSLRGDA